MNFQYSSFFFLAFQSRKISVSATQSGRLSGTYFWESLLWKFFAFGSVLAFFHPRLPEGAQRAPFCGKKETTKQETYIFEYFLLFSFLFFVFNFSFPNIKPHHLRPKARSFFNFIYFFRGDVVERQSKKLMANSWLFQFTSTDATCHWPAFF